MSRGSTDVRDQKGGAAAARAAEAEPNDGRAKRLLLVDDDPLVAWAVGRFLTRAGIDVTTCGDGVEALDLLRKEEFDALITDVQMPRLNGLAVIEWVSQHRPTLPVMVMTAFGAPSVRQVAMKKGAVLYLEKPVDPQLLLDLLTDDDEADTFSGTIHGIDLLDYLQLLLISRQRTVLEVVDNEGETARVYIDQGAIAHVSCGEEVGERAFFRTLEFHGGTFRTGAWTEPPCRTVETPGEYLLLEAARRRDEGALARPIVSPAPEGPAANELSIDLEDLPALDDALEGGD